MINGLLIYELRVCVLFANLAVHRVPGVGDDSATRASCFSHKGNRWTILVDALPTRGTCPEVAQVCIVGFVVTEPCVNHRGLRRF